MMSGCAAQRTAKGKGINKVVDATSSVRSSWICYEMVMVSCVFSETA